MRIDTKVFNANCLLFFPSVLVTIQWQWQHVCLCERKIKLLPTAYGAWHHQIIIVSKYDGKKIVCSANTLKNFHRVNRFRATYNRLEMGEKQYNHI